MKSTYRYWVNKEGNHLTGNYYDFKCFKVYWAYRWSIAEKIDYHTSITPVKKQYGMVIEPTNYSKQYK